MNKLLMTLVIASLLLSGCGTVNKDGEGHKEANNNYENTFKNSKFLVLDHKFKTEIEPQKVVVSDNEDKVDTYKKQGKNKVVEVTKQESKKEDEYMLFELTAYYNSYSETGKRKGDKYYGITASGEKTVEGVTIAADWRVLPKGTKVWIEGVGERVVQDKGGKIKGKIIDIYFDDAKDVVNFGRKKNVKVKIID